MAFPNGHPECIWCGTCKMLAVQRAPGPVAFVGEGHSDRFGALYADIVFAKDELVELCRDDGVPFLPYAELRRRAASARIGRRSAGRGRSITLPGMDDRLRPELSARTLTIDDVDATIAMINACELHDSGEVMWERADLLTDIRTDGFDLARDWVGVFDRERIVAWGLYIHPRRAWVDVHPDQRNRGVGTWLRRWAEERARARGADRVAQVIDDARTDVGAMFTASGYTPRHTSWILRMDHATEPAAPTILDGIAIRAIRPDDESPTMAMFETAFSEFADRLPSSETTWRAMTVEREGFEPEDLLVAIDGTGDRRRAAARLRGDLGGQAGRRGDASPPRRRTCTAPDGVSSIVRTRLRPHVPVDRLAHRRAVVIRARRHARHALVHELGPGPLGRGRQSDQQPAARGLQALDVAGRSREQHRSLETRQERSSGLDHGSIEVHGAFALAGLEDTAQPGLASSKKRSTASRIPSGNVWNSAATSRTGTCADPGRRRRRGPRSARAWRAHPTARRRSSRGRPRTGSRTARRAPRRAPPCRRSGSAGWRSRPRAPLRRPRS